MAWQAVLAVDEISEGQTKIISLGGKYDVGIIMHEGKYYAVLNFCPHAGAPICMGEVQNPVFSYGVGKGGGRNHEAPVIRCPWHHWEFDLTTSKALCAGNQKIRTYPVQVKDGSIWIDA